MPNETKATSIVDWFDPKEIRHLSAYKYLCETGFWPDNFVPDNVEFPSHWYFFLDGKIAKFFVNERLDAIKGQLESVKLVTRPQVRRHDEHGPTN